MGIGIVRIEAESLAEFLDRLLVVSGLQQRHPQIIMSRCEVRTELDRFPKLIEHQLRIVPAVPIRSPRVS